MKNSKKPLFILLFAVIGILMIILFLIPGTSLIKNIFNPDSTISDITEEAVTSSAKDDITKELTTFTEKNNSFEKETVRNDETTQTQTSPDDEILISEAIYVVVNTPGGKGTEMKSLATDTSETKGTIPENTRVRILSDDESNKTGYVHVHALINPMDIHCYIKKEYLEFSEYPSFYETPDENNRHVSYNTPGHAGLNMREQPSSSSEIVCSLPEGFPVFIAEPYSPDNHGYVKVGCDEYSSGETIYGWALNSYLVN